ncbi:MAG: VOC family protein [Crocinitomicaceae bacterium]|nr:VOC family protein [Crocinitomicaceae bacterium]
MNTQKVYLEHANITVQNLNSATTFFQTAFPDFKVRGGGTDNGKQWIHLGNDVTYLALNSTVIEQELHHEKDYIKNGINHIGFVVEDVEGIANRLLAAGFERDYPKQVEKFRIRDYFADADGNEFEFVQYLSDDLEERNSFEG